MFKYQFTRRFSLGHRFVGNSSPKCSSLHGHDMYVIYTLTPNKVEHLDLKNNMICEFSLAKKDFHNWIDNHLDHSLAINNDDPLLEWLTAHEPSHRLTVTPGDPTTEVLSLLLMCKCNAYLKHNNINMTCNILTLQETPTNAVTVEWDNTCTFINSDTWWNRCDNTTNDLPKA